MKDFGDSQHGRMIYGRLRVKERIIQGLERPAWSYGFPVGTFEGSPTKDALRPVLNPPQDPDEEPL